MKTFQIFNFGCRVNAAESNLFAQKLLHQNYLPAAKTTIPDIIFINTCSITKKANVESLGLIRRLQKKYPAAKIIVSGCASLKNLKNTKNLKIFTNTQKETELKDLNCSYTPKIADKFSRTHRFLLKVQSGCTHFCSYCTVPYTRPYLWSLPLKGTIAAVKKAVTDGYKEVIITGVNLDQYTPGFSNLVESLLQKTDINLISFGSIPINCLDQKFFSLLQKYPKRISKFIHIPIQSGSDKILKLMHRPYTQKIILEKFKLLKDISPLSSKRGLRGDFSFGTDIIVGFPGETETDFKNTYHLCQKIGFQKIHVFRYSPRPSTQAQKLFEQSPKISKETLKNRSQKLRSLISQTTLPSRQKPGT